MTTYILFVSTINCVRVLFAITIVNRHLDKYNVGDVILPRSNIRTFIETTR